MLRYTWLYCCLFLSTLLTAQTAPQERDASMPYPAANYYDSEDARDFSANFNVTDVGNLHVYDAELAEGTSEDYMQGVAVSPTHYRFLPKKIRRQMSKGHKVYAVHSIRGEAQEYLLIKHPPVKGSVEYGLYAFDGESLSHLVDLAGHVCKGSNCTQMDSWIRDIDGDTRLDVIQKVKKGDRPAKMKVYMQTDRGTFKRDRSRALDPVKYPMQERS